MSFASLLVLKAQKTGALKCKLGFLHPLIHLGFGLEFRQPAIIAEALAMTSVHIDDVGAVIYDTETISRGKKAKSMIGSSMKSEAMRDC